MSRLLFFLTIMLSLFSVNIYAFEMDDIKRHGFLSQGYMKTDGNNYTEGQDDGSLDFREIGINFTYSPAPVISMGFQLFAFEYGHLGERKIKLDWVNINWQIQDWLCLKAGLIKIPLGLYNETRDIDMLRTFIFLPGSVYNEVWRDLYANMKGLSVYGYLPSGFSYSLQAGSIHIDDDSGYYQTLKIFLNNPEITDIRDSYIAALQWDSSFGLKLKTTYNYYELSIIGQLKFIPSFPETAINYESCETSTFSAEFGFKNLILAAEYLQHKTDVSALITMSPAVEILQTGGTKSHGYYLSSTYVANEWFQIGIYYNRDFLDKQFYQNIEKESNNDLAFAVRFDINDNLIFKCEYHDIDGTLHIYPELNADGIKEKTKMFAVKFTYSF